jgi:DNA-directed RNA polymerase specialized sigma24 family protein
MWHDHQAEIRGYLIHRLADPAPADDIAQDGHLRSGQSSRPSKWQWRPLYSIRIAGM